jgi:hypothetical protein
MPEIERTKERNKVKKEKVRRMKEREKEEI